MIKYWGEIPVSSSQPSRSSFDLLQREFRTVEIQDPPLHQPSAERPRAATVLDVPSEPCGLTLHTIQLIQYNRRLRGLVAAAQGQAQAQAQAQGQPQADGLKAEEPEPLPPPPSSPLLPEELLPLDSKTPTFPFQLRHSDPESDFYRGKGEPATELSWTSCRQLLYQSVATVLAHAGFECAHESVLETLTDVASEYYYKFTRLLRSAADREARVGRTPFQDVMEQVFHEMGIGSVLSLQSFWQHRIKDYHTYMLQVSKQLAEEYEKLVSPEKTSAEDTKPLKIKEEPLSDIAFPVNEENEADLPTGEQALQLGVLAQAHERYAATLEVDASPQTSGPEVSSSPLWNLNQVKMEPQESEEGSGPPHGVLGNDVFEEPMSAMSDSGIPQTPNTTGSDGSYISHSPDSLMASSPVFNQRPKKRLRKN